MSEDRGAALAMRGVSVVYAVGGGEAIHVLENAHWTLSAGSQVAVCGPSGCGKSTLLHLLAGIETPASGTVRWDEAHLTTLSSRRRDAWRRSSLGMVFQQFHLFPGLSAIDNVLLPATFTAVRASDEERKRAARLLEHVGIAPGHRAEALSRGEQQRVAIARALAGNPRVVLADEPTASLDRTSAAIVRDLLRTLCRRSGATLVVATHDLDLATRLDRTYELRDGKLDAMPREPRAASGAARLTAA